MRYDITSSMLTWPRAVALFSVLTAFANAQGPCWLCGSPANVPKRFDYELSDGRTCATVYVDLYDTIQVDDPMCQIERNFAQSLCCDDEGPPTPAPIYTGPIGNEPECPICTSPEFPGIPGAFIVARYVGTFTCGQLYGRGLNGLLSEALCGPLQDFAFKECGCGKYNPKCIADETECWDGPDPGPKIIPGPGPSPAPPAGMPTLRPRKESAQSNRDSKRISQNRGGAGGGPPR